MECGSLVYCQAWAEKGKGPTYALRGIFFQLEVMPLLVPRVLSECLPVLLTRAEAAFCSLGN